VEGVEAAEIALQGERGGVLRERSIDLDDAEGGPLVLNGPGRARSGGEADRSHGLDEPGAATCISPRLRPSRRERSHCPILRRSA